MKLFQWTVRHQQVQNIGARLVTGTQQKKIQQHGKQDDMTNIVLRHNMNYKMLPVDLSDSIISACHMISKTGEEK